MGRNAARIAIGLASGSILLPAAALGQTTPDDREILEEIVVTADRQDSFGAELVQAGSFRGARQAEIPLTVSVLPRRLLDAQQANNLGDALRNTAGVTGLLTSPTVYNNLSIRGIPLDGRNNFRLNGSLSIVNFIDLPLENKARVEVLKGVSALYYGFSTPAGIVNLVTRQPPDDPLVRITTTATGHGQLQAALDAGATFGRAGARLTLAGGPVDSGIERTSGHRRFQAATFKVRPSSRLQLNLDIEHIFKQVSEPTIWQGPPGRSRLLTRLPKLPPPDTNPGSEGFINRASETNILGRLRWQPADSWALTVEAGSSRARRDRRFSVLSLFDPITGNGSLLASASDDQKFSNRSGRADLTGIVRTGALTHDLVLGVSTNRRRQYLTPATVVVGVGTQTGRDGCVALGLDSTCIQSGYEPVPLANIRFTASTPYDPSRDTTIDDTGVYAFDRIRFGEADRLSVILGLRKSFYRESVATAAHRRDTTFHGRPWSFSGGLIAKARPGLSAYASYIEGIESVPPAPNSTANAGQILPPGESRQYEVGIKFEPMGGLLATAAWFNIRRQLIYVNADNFFVNDGLATYRGWELGLSGEVSSELSVYGSAILLDATQHLSGDPVIDGNRPENTARVQWSMFAEYRPTRLIPGFALNAGVFRTGRRAINPENSLFVPGFTLVDVGGAYQFQAGGRDFVARVTARNIGGMRYFASTASNLLAYGPPSEVKFSLEMSLF